MDGVVTTNIYIYDNLGRLISEQINSDAAVSYSYDLAGNRLTAGASNFTYTHNKFNGAYHDVAGNITNMVRNGVTLDLEWNSQGQLTSVSTNGVFAESYTWGPLGNRLSTSNAAGVVFHAYDGAQCVADYAASGDLIASYTWGTGIDNLLAVTVYESGETNTYYAIKDHLNSVHALIDESGTVVWSCSYSAWGIPSIINNQSSTVKLRFTFQGREYSHATGLYNFRARWYDSNIGRWLSKDPIGLEGGVNLYVFCGNDPVNFVDPWGEATTKIDGNVIRVHLNDVDKWPSSPHGHIMGGRQKQVVDSSGRIFSSGTRKQVGRLSKAGRTRWTKFLGGLTAAIVMTALEPTAIADSNVPDPYFSSDEYNKWWREYEDHWKENMDMNPFNNRPYTDQDELWENEWMKREPRRTCE